jgi:hypothetical protein
MIKIQSINKLSSLVYTLSFRSIISLSSMDQPVSVTSIYRERNIANVSDRSSVCTGQRPWMLAIPGLEKGRKHSAIRAGKQWHLATNRGKRSRSRFKNKIKPFFSMQFNDKNQ